MTTRGRRSGIIAAAALASVAACTTAVQAQTGAQIPLQFDFLNPGAKSLALGGAFAGVADDATATFANPAGLTLLGGSELSVELRDSRITTEFLSRGRLSGTITNQGVDTVQGPVFEDSAGKHFGAGYLAAVYAHASHRWVVAGYRHELVRIDQAYLNNGVFQQAPSEFTSRRDSPQSGVREVTITSYGVGGSYKLRPDLALGAALTVYSFNLDSLFRRFDIDGFLGPPNLDIEVGRATQTGDDLAVAPTAGLLLDRGKLRVGVVFREGPSFVMNTQEASTGSLKAGRFRVPNVLAVGASLRVRPQLMIAGELTYITYSRLLSDYVTDQVQGFGHAAGFRIDNGTEAHVGMQYAMVRQGRPPIRLRLGTWFDPDHSIHFTPDRPPTGVFDAIVLERLPVIFSRGKNQVHVTGGIGLTLSPRLEFNAGVDIASTRKVASASIIAHVGKEN
jgi:hypothetical protein